MLTAAFTKSRSYNFLCFVPNKRSIKLSGSNYLINLKERQKLAQVPWMSQPFQRQFSFSSIVESKKTLWQNLCQIKEFKENCSTPEHVTDNFCSVYKCLDSSDKVQFLLQLATKLGHQINGLNQDVSTSGGETETKRNSSLKQLLDPSIPSYEHLFKVIGGEQLEGIAFLVHLRQDVLSLLKPYVLQNQDSELKHRFQLLDGCLKNLLSTWFAPSFLELKRITFDGTAGGVLERMAKYEAVHRIRSLEELKIRLGPGRRCYAFFHPSMPLEPLVFVYVALLPDMPDSMDYIKKNSPKTEEQENSARCATFYSISATQKGLSGVDLGNVLIKTVSKELQKKYPCLDTFVTLSPIPGFRTWLNETYFTGSGDEVKLLHDSLQKDDIMSDKLKEINDSDIPSLLTSFDWLKDEEKEKELEPVLMHLCSRYLLQSKRGNKIRDPVANFHIRNGANMERLNWKADLSKKGLENSFGIMINYKYIKNSTFENSLQYINSGKFSIAETFVNHMNSDTIEDISNIKSALKIDTYSKSKL